MILDRLTLRNFGIYGGEQEILLTPEEGRPVILFGGLNGGGKTTLLDSIQLVFYGRKARVSNRGALGYSDYLRSMIHRGADPGEGSALSLTFRRVMDGEPQQIRVTRAWWVREGELVEDLRVERNGEFDSALAENFEEYIQAFLPHGIAHLFFFDAEQIKDLAEGTQAREILRTAIHSLLGLDVVDRLETDLKVLERRKREQEEPDSEVARKCREAAEAVERFEQLLRDATNRKGRLTNEAAKLATQVRQLEQVFEREGGSLFEQRAGLEKQKTELQEKIRQEEEALRHHAAGPLPLLLVGNLLEQLETQARQDARIGEAQVVLKTLEERDRQFLTVLSPAARKEAGPLLAADRSERAALASRQPLLPVDAAFVSELQHLRSQVLPKEKILVEQHLTALERLRQELDQVDAQLARVPEADAIAGLQAELEVARRAHVARLGELRATNAELESVSQKLEAAKAALARREEERDQAGYEDEDRQKVVTYSKRMRTTLESFRSRIIRRHIATIERLMLESFQLLLRKESLVSGLSIDPESYDIQLTGGDGRPLPLDRLSAGERQLLATSLLWGLARASGRPLPTIIDTPLGRLDSSHRRHLVDRYFPVASHQVILLSTDEEIHEANYGRLRGSVSREYELEFDETTRGTQVQTGYFFDNGSSC